MQCYTYDMTEYGRILHSSIHTKYHFFQEDKLSKLLLLAPNANVTPGFKDKTRYTLYVK
jgi:hypothetical protein